MENRLTQLFKTKSTNILSVYFTAGFPKLNDTYLVASALQKSGADIIEIGIPFSDPIADGPIIQQSNKVALDNGMHVSLLLVQVRELRKQITLPIVLMGYLNPVYQYGVEKFFKDAKEAGADGVILPDMPLYEFEENYFTLTQELQLSVVFLITPTTSEERRKKIDQLSSGFVYAVSASSTTGVKEGFSTEQIKYFEELKNKNFNNPVLMGFGISSKHTFNIVCNYSAGAIIGSAFIKMLEQAKDIESDIDKFIRNIKE